MTEKAAQDGAWIFVSHSHKDLKTVREIRDLLEREGHNPLLFYLKCLDEQDIRLPQLIKDEIEARTWFVLCNSENARASKWVQDEIKIIKSKDTNSKFFVEIDIAEGVEPQKSKLTRLSKRATVFLSYSSKDQAIARAIYAALLAQDYRIFFAEASIEAGARWTDAITTNLQDAVELGFVLLLLSSDYLRSRWCEHERELAFAMLGSKQPTNIVPVIINDHDVVKSELPRDLAHVECLELHVAPDGSLRVGAERGTIDALLADLKKRSMA